jgi:superfamily II DNA/RNA helicase
MGEAGRAITFVTPEQGGSLTEIEMLVNTQLEKLSVEGFSATTAPRERTGREALVPVGSHAQSGSEGAVPTQAAARPAPGGGLGGKYPVPRRFRRR